MKTLVIIYGIIAVVTFIIVQIYSIKEQKENGLTKWWLYLLNFIINIIFGGILWPLFWLLRLIGVILQMIIEKNK